MATTDTHAVHVSLPPGASHLTMQLRINNDRKRFFRPCCEKLERVRYRLQILASDQQTVGGSTSKHRHGGTAPLVSVKFFDMNDQEISPKMTVGDALMRTKRLQLDKENFVVLYNQPLVTDLKVLEPVMIGIPIFPVPKTQFLEVEECSWRWFRMCCNEKSFDENSATLICSERSYTPLEDEVGCSLYIECRVPATHSEYAEDSKAVIMTMPLQPGPNRDVFKSRRLMGYKIAPYTFFNLDAFRVMSYNVLYNGYATTEYAKKNLFPHADANVIKETRRIQLQILEITENNSDIVCLQEMGEHAYTNFFKPIMASFGYHGFYSEKTGTTKEGCATFIRTMWFEVITEHTVDLANAIKHSSNAATRSFLIAYPEIAKGIKRIPSIAQVLVLRSKQDPARNLIVSNTHLFYREDAHLIRLLQGVAVVDSVCQYKYGAFEDAAVVICGDLNAMPYSALVDFLLAGHIDSSHGHWQQAPLFRWNLSRDDSQSKNQIKSAVQVHPNRFEHSLELASACGIPDFTNYVIKFVGTLDYILITSKVLKVLNVFPLFTEEEVKHEVALPSSTFPSDHISLVCDLTW